MHFCQQAPRLRMNLVIFRSREGKGMPAHRREIALPFSRFTRAPEIAEGAFCSEVCAKFAAYNVPKANREEKGIEMYADRCVDT